MNEKQSLITLHHIKFRVKNAEAFQH